MPSEIARFLIELLHGEEHIIAGRRAGMAADNTLTADHRTSLLDLQSKYEDLCDLFRTIIKEHE
jgi:hypothetical protein